MNTELTCECNGITYSSTKCLKEHKNTKSHKTKSLLLQSNENNNNQDNIDKVEELLKKYNELLKENEELKTELVKVKNSYLSILFDFNKY